MPEPPPPPLPHVSSPCSPSRRAPPPPLTPPSTPKSRARARAATRRWARARLLLPPSPPPSHSVCSGSAAASASASLSHPRPLIPSPAAAFAAEPVFSSTAKPSLAASDSDSDSDSFCARPRLGGCYDWWDGREVSTFSLASRARRLPTRLRLSLLCCGLLARGASSRVLCAEFKHCARAVCWFWRAGRGALTHPVAGGLGRLFALQRTA